MNTIDVHELARRQRSAKIDLIDVRTPVEFREVHVPGAVNFPLDRLDPAAIRSVRRDQGTPLYVICKSGGRSGMAVQRLTDAGLDHVTSVEGGTAAWDAAGLPVNRGKKAMSLERQVRIVAGLLTLIGAVLGYWVHPAFIGLSAFIGAGLMFAGITDTCGMGMMLAKMPWNQVRDGSDRSTSCTVS